MSRHLEVIFSFDFSEKSYEQGGTTYFCNMDKINNWLALENHEIFFRYYEQSRSGFRYFITPLFIAGFKNFCIEDFATFLISLEWKRNQSVQLLTKTEDCNTFTEYAIKWSKREAGKK